MAKPMIRAALWYARYGWRVVPLHTPLFGNDGECTGCTCEEWKREKYHPDYVCKTPGKHPRVSKWQEKATDNEAQIVKWWNWWPMANIGVAAGLSGLIAVDVDSYKTGGEPIPFDTITSITGGGGQHAVFLHPDIDEKLGNSKQGLPAWVDVRGHGGQFVAPPSLHPSGNRYRWEDGRSPLDIDAAPLPDTITAPLLQAIREKENAIANRQSYEPGNTEERDVAAALACLPPLGEYEDYWLKILMAVHSEFPGSNGVALIEAWSPGGRGEVEMKFKSFNRSGVGIGTLFHMAKEYGYKKEFSTVCKYDEV